MQFVAYGQSKTANIWMANEIERRCGAQGLHALSLHPGVIDTNLSRHISSATSSQAAPDPAFQAYKKDIPQGAATTILAAVGEEFEGKGGVYLAECRVAPPMEEGLSRTQMSHRHMPYAYDEAGEKRLWQVSCEMVGAQA